MNDGTVSPQKAAFFDLDLTITYCDSFRCYLRNNYLNQWRNWPFVPQILLYGILRKLRLVSLQTFKERALVSLSNKNEYYIKNIGEQYFQQYLVHTIRKAAYDKISLHKHNGDLVFIVSASPDIYVHSVADHLQCDGYFCSRLAYRNGEFLGKFEGTDCIGPEKIKALMEIVKLHDIVLADCYAYSDHHSDLPLLESVGYPIVVSPTSTLRQFAVGKGWTIENW